MTEKEYWIALSTFTGFGPARLKLLYSYFKKARNIWKAADSELAEIGLGYKKISDFINHRKNFDFEKYFERLEKNDVKAITIFEKDYPQNLKDISDSPYVLYVRGEIKNADSRAVAIVGSRLMTSYGREVADKFATELSNFGITIISGLALGIDAEAQRSALKAGGRTIAVLASGLDIISPVSNKSLALEFIKKNGALISEYPLGHIPYASDFAVRNRLISGLSRAVLVVEGRMKSGTFYTVNAAATQGRPVFAVPGPITSPSSEAPNYLIQNGAKTVVTVKDILDELDIQFKVDSEAVENVLPEDPLEKKILEILAREPLLLDELVRISGCPVSQISGRLTIMEMKGLVKNSEGTYRKT